MQVRLAIGEKIGECLFVTLSPVRSNIARALGVLLVEHFAVKNVVLLQVACVPHCNSGNSMPDLSSFYTQLAVPLLECLMWKAQCNAFCRLCRDVHLPARCFLLFCPLLQCSLFVNTRPF